MKKEATFGAGCFWCIEACFKDIQGVLNVIPGYAGGDENKTTYKEVCEGDTGHAEVARIVFDDELVSFEKLLELFWFVHDPTQLNRQGNDIGSQYRSVIFYHNDEQKAIASEVLKRIDASDLWSNPVVTAIEPIRNYSTAEQYHQNYYNLNKETNGYCNAVIGPKVVKFQLKYKDLIKE